ncbi:MAG: radical SAM protein [Deltaproteobacteria bacterium]|nr:radical SAM protein [Deltaproteobacteria bacterium]
MSIFENLTENSLLKLLQRKAGTYLFNRNYTVKRLLNVARSVYYYRYSKHSVVKSKPVRMVIDAGNICQLKCPLCPTGLERPTRQKSLLKFEDFKKIIDEAGSYLCEVDLYNWGEPFLNPDIFKMIGYAKKMGIKVTISSNLNLIKEGWIEEMIQLKLDHLTVSLDGTSAKSYEKYRIGGNFNTVLSNLKKIVALKRQYKSKYPKITWQFLIMKHNEHEMEEAKRLSKEIGVDELHLRPVRCDMGMELLMNDAEKIESAKAWLPTQDKHSRYNYKTKAKKNPLSKCLFQTTTMVVNANGSVSPCCGVYDEKWDLGNALKDGVFNVWNNPKYQQARKAVLEKDTSDENLICSYCIKNGFLEY